MEKVNDKLHALKIDLSIEQLILIADNYFETYGVGPFAEEGFRKKMQGQFSQSQLNYILELLHKEMSTGYLTEIKFLQTISGSRQPILLNLKPLDSSWVDIGIEKNVKPKIINTHQNTKVIKNYFI